MQVGFIILRHVNNDITNKYWIHCYHSIRNCYPENKIIIIDDNSNYNFITNENLYNTTIINSEYPKRGELLPYYYYLHNKLFDTAVILHDSVFVNQYIDFTVDKYKLIWEFEHEWDNIADERRIISIFNDPELAEFYENKHLWKGCFGAMSIITHDYLTYINNKYDIGKLLECILNRDDRKCFERIIACLLQKNYKKETLLGSIHRHQEWNLTFNDKGKYNHLPLVKIWTGR
jgi:hypothetical protein